MKPLNGWRAFSGEVGIIVLGVLIALAAQQVVEKVHERNVAAETRAAIADELNDGLAAITLRRMAAPCIDRRLNELRAILAQWGTVGNIRDTRLGGANAGH